MIKSYLLILVLLFPFALRGQIITTVAGNGSGIYNGDGELANSASIGNPGGIVFDDLGNFYFTEYNNTVRKVSSIGIITTIAGNGTMGSGGDGGIATTAELNNPSYITVDLYGNLYISDFYNNKIRKVNTTTNIITTVVGNGGGVFEGDGGTATAASLYSPDGLAFDSHNNLYISDDANQRIRKVNTTGIITTIAGNGTLGSAGDGGQATAATVTPSGGMCIDAFDNLYYCDNNRIRKINLSSGIINTVAGNGTESFSGDGGLATNAQLFFPRDIKIDAFGNLYISDVDNNRIRIVNTSGIINTIVGNGIGAYNGDGGLASGTEIYSPRGLALDVCNNLYIADNGNNRIRKVTYPKCNYLAVPEVITNNTELSIYPNPTYDILNINNLKTESNYRLLSIVGAVIQQGTLKEGNNSISILAIPNGMYMLEVMPSVIGSPPNQAARQIMKIVKQ